jgi:CHAT domain-containing protein
LAPQHLSKLILVLDGPLHLMPFSALISGDGDLLNEHLTLSTAPSATVYAALKTAPPRTAADKPFLGVAYSPIMAGPDAKEASSRALTALRQGNVGALKFAREEVTEAASSFGSKSVTLAGADASEAKLKAEPLSEFKVIHLAAHGIGDDTEPDRAALVLLSGDDEEDGLWQAREIRHARLNADLVVLSACETGSGRLQGEEGVMNLARAFLIAGARSVVASLWSVEDGSTATLMGYFYDHLAAGLTVNESLRQAQIDFIREYKGRALPYYWAGFEVIGDGTRRLETTKVNSETTGTNLR